MRDEWDKIIHDNYFEHYKRGNINIDPEKMSTIIFNQMQALYGEYVNSLPEGSRVLDLGCGIGFFLYWLSKQKNIVPVGVDKSASQLAAFKNKFPNIEVHKDDGIHFLSNNKNNFEGIYCIDVIEHIPTMEQALDLAHSALDALKPGGFFFCRLPNAANITSAYLRYIDITHYRSFTSRSLHQYMEAAGFKDISIISQKEVHLKGLIRSKLEHYLHKFLYRLTNTGPEDHFFQFIHAVGWKRD